MIQALILLVIQFYGCCECVSVTNKIEIKMSQFVACFCLCVSTQKTFLLKANNFRFLFTAAKRALNHQ